MPDKEHSHRIAHVQCDLTQSLMRNKTRLKAVKKKQLPFANPSSSGGRRASHALLGWRGSGSLTVPFPKILLPTAISTAQSAEVEVIWAATVGFS